MIRYEIPSHWIKYDPNSIQQGLLEARVAIRVLQTTPYQKDWVEDLQKMELKREVAGTSRIEGADFTEGELEEALRESPEQLITRSQKQAHAAVQTYRWIAELPDDKPLDANLIREIHRRIVTGADDDHCEPGKLRTQDLNVDFGQPRHRGANGGEECEKAFAGLAAAINREFHGHDPILQALAAHYHFAAIHPFLDGNGRTARALEALMLRRAGLRDICFIAMSNYYYEEKIQYLSSMSAVREKNYDLTPFFLFALKGVASQANRIGKEIQLHIAKGVYRNLMYDLFLRLRSPRKRVIAKRQIEILKVLLERDSVGWDELFQKMYPQYDGLKNPLKAIHRDMMGLHWLGAIERRKDKNGQWRYSARLEWPREIGETDFLELLKSLPKAKSHEFLDHE